MWEKMNINPYLIPYIKINLKWEEAVTRTQRKTLVELARTGSQDEGEDAAEPEPGQLCQQTKLDLERVPRNCDPTLHPFAVPQE